MVKREPESFAACCHSSTPSASPSSQCGFGVKSYARFSPQVRTTWLSFSSAPVGTLSCGGFGTSISSRPSSASTSASSASDFFTASPSSRRSPRAFSPAALSVFISSRIFAFAVALLHLLLLEEHVQLAPARGERLHRRERLDGPLAPPRQAALEALEISGDGAEVEHAYSPEKREEIQRATISL